MANPLRIWENEFKRAILDIEINRKNTAGAILSVVPHRMRWEDYLDSVRSEWANWKISLGSYPACLVVLYCGIAFFNYEDLRFWCYFSEAVSGRPGADPPSPSHQTQINKSFRKALEDYQFKIVAHAGKTDFVGSAIWHIGIPLSLWDGFIDICEWASWQLDWKSLSSTDWTAAVGKRIPNRPRLTRFLIDNRAAAASFIQEIIDVRDILKSDINLTIEDLTRASILRHEFFDEVPETAEFIRPQNPDSLFKNRARIVWSESRRKICVQLPGINREHLPAIWRIGTRQQQAASTPTEMVLDAEVFQRELSLVLKTTEDRKFQHLIGASPWGLFDVEAAGQLVNSNRDVLPLKSYALVSAQKIEKLNINGFDQAGSNINEIFELSDGTTSYVTRLWPTGKYAEIEIGYTGETKKLRFKTRAKIEVRHFFGKQKKSAYFSRMSDGTIRCEEYPIFCVAIPRDYFRDNYQELCRNFRIREGESAASGHWEQISAEVGDREYFEWRWGDKPFIEIKSDKTVKDLRRLRDVVKLKDSKGKKFLSIKSPEFSHSFIVEKVGPNKGIDERWNNLPGRYAIWFILCQAGLNEPAMKMDDILIARDVIAPDAPETCFSYSLLRKYESLGFLIQKGNKWEMARPRAEVGLPDNSSFELKYCGDPSVLWRIYRKLSWDTELPIVEVVNKRNEVPFLRMVWNSEAKAKVESELRNRGVEMVRALWSH
jgi:hypothetical protein